MKRLTIEEMLNATGGKLLTGKAESTALGFSTDSRQVEAENGFFALPGENFDGHDFLGKVLERGCRTVVVSDAEKAEKAGVLHRAGEEEEINVILVENTLKALQDLAKYYLGLLPLKKKIAVTGSVGKTSTRDMLYYIARTKYRTGRNLKNFNNEIGLPLTLLSFDEDLEVAVLEMGMDNFGEIDLLADMVRPDIAVITNIGISHIETLGSREGILKAKMEVTNYFNSESVLVVNQSCDLLSKEKVEGDYQLITVGADGRSDYVVSNVCDFGDKGIKYTLDRNHKQYEIQLPVAGAHNAINGSLAIAACQVLGISVEEAAEGLANAELTDKRLNIRGKNGIKVIDDTYNACPESMRSAINTLVATKGLRKVAILGDMRELGPESKRFHREVGQYAGEKGIDLVIAIGEEAKALAEGSRTAMGMEQVMYFATKEGFMKELPKIIVPGDVVLVKASRTMEMEQIVKKIFEDKE
ncbi:MAG: UDP-N-acetylmuramoyl-tripeptide--D-alanyl-D-alanine ligase [Firmicutes bacterium]|nr:UDP-N-acetylmuramoyl-tripeptide--D-alanyl-D-alanine ligase [Bacillota bacterium]